jgi:CRP-like cAMP-binding protein
MKKGELGRLYSDGEVLCREGEEGSVMYVIQDGQVKIKKQTDSREVEIADLYAGDIFGEMALFEKQPRSATAIVSGEARVLSVDRKKLFQLIDGDPMLVLKILESMSQRIRKMDEELARLKNR